MRFAALRGNASFSVAPVVVTVHGSTAPGTTVARTVRYNLSARPKQSKPGPRFEVEAGTRTSIIMQGTSTSSRKVLQHGFNRTRPRRNSRDGIRKRAADRRLVRRGQGLAVIPDHVVGVFQQIAGKHRDNAFVLLDRSRAHQLANSRNRRRRRRLAANTVAPNHRLRIRNLLFADGDHITLSLAHSTPRFLPRNRCADLYRRRQRLRVLFVNKLRNSRRSDEPRKRRGALGLNHAYPWLFPC